MTSPASQPLAGRFVIEREVGRGGVGIVYRANDRMSGQDVALKVIAIPGVDAGEEARFRREGRLLASLNHPGIVKVVAFGQFDEGAPYVAMEWLVGEDFPKARAAVRELYEKERLIRPEGTRSVSYEIFVIGLGRRKA